MHTSQSLFIPFSFRFPRVVNARINGTILGTRVANRFNLVLFDRGAGAEIEDEIDLDRPE